MTSMKASGARILFFLSILVLPGSGGMLAAESVVALKLGVDAGDDAMVERVADAVAGSLSGAIPGISVAVAERPERAANLSVWQSLQNGTVDAALVSMGGIASRIGGLAGLNEPFLFADADAAERFYTGGGGARIAELLSRRGVIVAGWIGTGAPYLLSRIPLESAETFKNLRIAVGMNSGAARELAALGASAVPLPGGQRLDMFFSGAYDVIEVEDLSWIEGRKENLDGVRAYGTDYAFPYWALCLSGSAKAGVSPASWTALLDATRESAAAGMNFAARSAFESYALLLERGGESNVVSLNRFLRTEESPPDGESAGNASPGKTIPAGLDPVLKKEIEEIIEIKNQSDFGG